MENSYKEENMFKNMKLGAKIITGFILLVIIAVGLGGMAIWNMSQVKKTAIILATENIPEVGVANEIERNSLKTMYEIRGYAFTEEEAFLTNGKGYLVKVKEHLNSAKAHGASSIRLAKLTEAATKAESAALQYEQLLEKTVTLTKAIESERQNADAAAQKYMEMCSLFLKDQNAALQSDITEGKDAEALKERLKKINFVNEIVDMGNWIVAGTWKSQARRDPDVFKETQKIFDKVYPKLDELKAITRLEKNLKQIEECRAAAKTYEGGMKKFLDLWLDREDVNKKRNEVGNQVLAESASTAQMGMEDTKKGAEGSAKELGGASTLMLYGLISALAIGLLLAFFITRSITRPIFRIISGLTDGSEEVSSAAGQVSSSAQSLAEGSSEQAASIEETSSSLEEMSSMTKQNAANSQQANILMEGSKAVVDDANGSMQQLIVSMDEISRASEETSKIIKTIDEIAFQTNLLALNAAVEAARAGEVGAGFAVVADEVRNLAMRAADAAKNTAGLIEGTVKKVKDGSDLVNRTNEAFQKVAESSGKVAGLVSEIAAASNEQAKGIGQINIAVTELDKLTQQNAANAEESASASEEMSAQAETMLNIVGELVSMVGNAHKNGHKGQIESVGKSLRSGKAISQKRKPMPKAEQRAKSSETAAQQLIPFDEQGFEEF
jgi:methyl-accepting chemotaxis protein